MRPLITMLVALAVSLAVATPTPASAGVDVQVHIGLPVAPPLVVVQPGVSVVEDWGEEVFFVSPYYWVRRGDLWYRARSPRAAFRAVPMRAVPVKLVRMPPGQYVKYKKGKHEHYRQDDRRRGHDGSHRDRSRGHKDRDRHDRGHRDGHDGGHGRGKHKH